MNVIWKIAFRNLREHKVKTLIIGSIVALGVTVLVVGNSLMDTAAAGIRRNYIENYTGHIIVGGAWEGNLTLFGAQGFNGSGTVTPSIPQYEKVLAYVRSHPHVGAVSPQATAMVIASVGEDGQVPIQLFGVDPELYRQMFPGNLKMIDGEFLSPKEEGILLSETCANRLEKVTGQEIFPGAKVLLTGMNAVSGIRIREVPVRGIFRFKQSNPQLDMVSLVDITNLRALAGMAVTHITAADLTETEKALLGEIDDEALFDDGGEELFGGSLVEEITESELTSDLELPGGDSKTFEIARSKIDRSGSGASSQAWHFLLIRLDSASRAREVRADLQDFFERNDIAAQTVGWLTAAGPIAEMAYGVKNVFNIIVVVVAVVAVIIIMNTLVVSIMERVPEIGTMRAMGAQKSFIRQLVIRETVMIAGVFGLIGLMVGGLILAILHFTGLEAPNMFFRIIFGGDVLRPVFSPQAALLSLVMVAVIGVLSCLYPVSLALRIEPVKAMQSR